MDKYTYNGKEYRNLEELYKVNIYDSTISFEKFKKNIEKGHDIERALKKDKIERIDYIFWLILPMIASAILMKLGVK